MEDIIREEEIDGIVQRVLADFRQGKNIDEVNIFNKPDKSEVREMVNNLFRIV